MSNKVSIKTTFDAVASQYGEFGCNYFDHFGKRLVEISQLTVGEKVLDVATGKGAVLIPALKAIGQTGHIIGIDLSSQMLKETKERISAKNVDLIEMDAENLSFKDGSFSTLFSAFALFFFPNLTKALSEFYRALQPHGKIAVSIWGSSPTLERWLINRCNEIHPEKKVPSSTLNVSNNLQKVLENAGFLEVKVIEEKTEWHHESKEIWWQSLYTHGTRTYISKLSSEELADLKKEAFEEAEKYMKNGKLYQTKHVLYAIAHKEL